MSKEFVVFPERNQTASLNSEELDLEKPSAESFVHGSFRILRRRKLSAVVALLVFTVPAAIFVNQRPPVYQATARLLLERNDDLTAVMKDSSVAGPPDNFFQTQQQLLRSRPIVVKAIQATKLWDVPQFSAPLSPQSSAEDISQSGLVERFLAHLFVVPTPGTHLLNVTFEATDPTVAKTAVNTLTDIYIKEVATSRGEESARLVRLINEKLAEQQTRLAASEAALQSYIATHDAVSVQDRQNIVVQKFSDLNTALTRAKTERMAKEAIYRQLEAAKTDPAGLDSVPVVLSNSILQQLRSQLAELKQKELRMTQDLGDRHPDLVKLRSEIDLTAKRLDAELAKVTESVKNDFVAAQAIEEDLTKALNEQKSEVVDLNRKSLDYGALQRQATSDRQIYERLLTESQTRGITANTADRTIRVIEPADQPLAPIGPQNRRDLMLVIAVGFLLAIGAPLTLEALDHRIKTPGDIEQRLRLPCLAMVAKLPRQADGKRPLMTNDASGYNEAFRRIRTAVTVANKPQVASRVLVTSAVPNEGKSLISANLAIAFAKAGQRVLLIDADLRRPTVHTTFELSPGPGLANLVRHDADAQTAIRGTSVPNLFVLTSGTAHDDAAELLSSTNLQAVLGTLESRFSWMVFDSPPMGPVTDACIVARLVAQTIFVVAAGTTTAAAASAAISQLKRAGATVAGVVLNRADLEKSSYYYYPHHQVQYSAYYQARADKRG